MMWKLLDHRKDEMANSGDDATTAKDVRMPKLPTYGDMMDKLDNLSVRELAEYAPNTAHDHSVVIYLSYHHNQDIVSAFSIDKLYLVD